MLKLLVALFGWKKSSSMFDLALTTWLDTSVVSFAFCLDELDSSSRSYMSNWNTHAYICKNQSAYPENKYHNFNTIGDNKPLHFIHKLNKTQSFNWLLFGDDDTCFHLKNVVNLLWGLNHSIPFFIGTCHPKNVKCCSSLSQPCYKSIDAWPHGGHGFIISRGLLDRIPETDWATCNAKFNYDGGDVRVARCIRTLTGITLTEPEKWMNCSNHRVDQWNKCMPSPFSTR